MIYTALTNKALKIAYRAHAGQTDKCGAPYIFHPAHVAEQMTDEASTCVALLHDVVEDSSVTLDDLRCDFPSDVVEAVGLLTHAEGVDYFDYVWGIKGNELAKKVKLADLDHNADQTRFAGNESVGAERLAQLQRKYAKARSILEE